VSTAETAGLQDGETAGAVIPPRPAANGSTSASGEKAPKSPWIAWLALLNVPALTAVLVWGGSFPIAKYALDEFSVVAYAVIRPLLAAGLMFGMMRLRQEPLGIERRDLPRLLLSGFGGMFLFQAGFIIGLDRTSSSHSALIASAAPPVLGAIVLWLLRGERPNRRAFLGLALGFSGVALLVSEASGDGATVMGDLISVGAALAWVTVTILPAPLVRRYGPFRLTAWLILCAGIAFIPFSLGAIQETAEDVPSFLAWGSLLYTAFLGMVTANTLWQRAVQKLGANQTMPYLYLQPAIALVLSALMLGERLGPIQLAGGLLARVGVGLVRR
jgi:drug/metabolite transporter (DMT)-like permease